MCIRDRVESLRNYVNNPKNANEVIPANVGLQDQNLGSIINQYNTMPVSYTHLALPADPFENVYTGVDKTSKRAATLTDIKHIKQLEMCIRDRYDEGHLQTLGHLRVTTEIHQNSVC